MTEIAVDTVDVSRYVMLRDSGDFTPETGYTITDLDLQYTRYGAAPAAKADATALGSTDAAHADNKAIQIDGTSSPGLYRVDWPDAAFATGAEGVTLAVTGAGLDPVVEDIRLVSATPDVNVAAISGDSAAADNLEADFDGTGYHHHDYLTTGFSAGGPNNLQSYLLALMSKAASAPAAGGTFDPTTDSVESLRELGDGMAGAGFATGTDSLVKIRDYIETMVAPSVVGSSAMSGKGFLSDCVNLIRKMTDEPSVDPKYTNGEIVDFLQTAFATIITDLNVNTDHPVLVRYNITLESGKQNYTLPPNVGEVWRVAKLNTTSGLPEYEMWPDNHFSSGQSGVVIEGNTLRLLRDWKSSDMLEILFVPLGEPLMHYGTAGTMAAGSITFAATPTDGTLDTRANAYAGYLVRILTSTGPAGYEKVVQERLITAYDNVTRVATLAEDWTALPTGTITYEVVPQYSLVLKHLVCLSAAMDILAIEASTKRLQALHARFVVKQRAMRLMVERKCARFPGHAEGDTSDNENRGGFLSWG
jgi:hypothetical protein